MASQTYYEVLELPPSASPTDVRKAYRRLALLHHPDRNSGSAESTERFKLINEAYEVLSDGGRRREYDSELRGGAAFGSSGATGAPYATAAGGRARHPRRHRARVDPYARFDDLFRNDPFFAAAFADMDDEFAQRFQKGSDRTDGARGGSGNKCGGAASDWTLTGPRKGWFPWLADCLGIQLTMTTVRTSADGAVSASSYSSNPREKTYTNKKTWQYVENGQRVVIRSMERDGNVIEDKYVDGVGLVERKVNGRVEPTGQIRK